MNLKSFSRLLFALSIALISLIVVSCGSGGNKSSDSSDSSNVTLNLGSRSGNRVSDAIPSNVVNIKFTISGPEGVLITRTVNVVGLTSITETFDVPNGPQRIFKVEAFDAGGVLVFEGSATADLDGKPITVAVYMTVVAPPSLLVKVITEQGWNPSPIPNVTVVLGNPDGSIAATAVTDAQGVVTFANPPVNAMVTAAATGTARWRPSQTVYALGAVYDVNVPAIAIALEIDVSPLGSATVNVTTPTPISGMDNAYVIPGYVGVPCTSGSCSGSVSATVYPYDMQSDGLVSFAAIGFAGATPVAYGVLLDQTFSSGMSVNLPINQTTFNLFTVSFLNTPATATFAEAELNMSRKDGKNVEYRLTFNSPIPSTFQAGAIPGFDTRYEYDADLKLDTNLNGINDAYLEAWRNSTTLSSQIIDWSPITAYIPSNLGISGAGADTPTISWTPAPAAASADDVWVDIDYSTTSVYYDYGLDVPPSRTNVVFPQLPASLAAFRPTWINRVRVNYDNIDLISGYDDIQTKYYQWVTGAWRPAEFSSMEAGKEYSAVNALSSGKPSGPGSVGETIRPRQRGPTEKGQVRHVGIFSY